MTDEGKRSPFFRLSAIVAANCGISEQQLLDALFLIRAHYSLAAIVECCMRLTRLLAAFPEIMSEPAFADQAERLATLRALGELVEIEPHFRNGDYRISRTASRPSDELTPLRPYTGESGLCELLLITPTPEASANGDAATNERNVRRARNFDYLKAWFAWQTFHHQVTCHSPRDHARYLKGDGTDKLQHGAGSRIYVASLLVRRLGKAPYADQAAQLVDAVSPFGEASSRRLIRMGTAFQRRPRISKGSARGEMPPGDVASPRMLVAKRLDLVGLLRFLRHVWQGDRVQRRAGGLRMVHAHGPRGEADDGAPDVRRYRDVWAITYAVESEDPTAGHVAELHAPASPPRPDDTVRVPEPVSAEDIADDPEDELSVEPELKLYLGNGDAMAAWYRGKSEAHHIESGNALLPWPKWRLSLPAIHAVVALVALHPHESLLDRRARLAVGLSLLSGRTLDAVATVVIDVHAPAVPKVIDDCIRVVDHVLHVPAARPDLKKFTYTPTPFPTYCAPWAGTLRLPLPSAWWLLVDALAGVPANNRKQVVKRAQGLLAGLPMTFAVTPKGVSMALRLAILEAGRGDLALLKAITDADEANLNNLIHYASYERRAVESLWSDIAAAWVGPVGPVPPVVVHGERVGSPFGIEVPKVAVRLGELKARFRLAVAGQRWRAVYNQLALYVSIWLGLATAGRRVCDPVPGVILADGWALIRDKSHADQSTDRYVPLGWALRRQIDILRGLSEILGLTDPDFALPEPGAEHLLSLRVFQNAGSDSADKRERSSSRRRLPRRPSLPFQPLYMDRTTVLRDLPGNWGRKLVRSSSPHLSGRFKDAGLGHWVRGRHPWSLTATFPSRQFKAEWLQQQAELERALGFEVLGLDAQGQSLFGEPFQPIAYPKPLRREIWARQHGEKDDAGVAAVEPKIDPGIKDATPVTNEVDAVRKAGANPAVAANARAVSRRPKWLNKTRYVEPPPLPVDEFMALVRDCEGEALYRKVFEAGAPDGGAALALCTAMLANARPPTPQAWHRLAQGVCAFVRTQTGVPLFAIKPRARFQRNWLVDQYEFECLAHVEQVILPAIQSDLGHLPARDVTKPTIRADLGRLIAALVVRGNLLNTAHLDACLMALGKGAPIVAIGELRALELNRVRSRRAVEPMRRTVLLEPYLATLVTVERPALTPLLRELSGRLPAKRYACWSELLGAHLRRLGFRSVSLAVLIAAARQRLMLDTSPIVAAYASGELQTHDLPVAEFCRLGGYMLPPLGGVVSDDVPYAPSDAAADDAAMHAIPADLRDARHDFAQRIVGFEDDSILAWRARLRGARDAATTPAQHLLCAFAAYLLNQYYVEGRRHGLGVRQRRTLSQTVIVVWAGLLQMEALGRLGDTLDEDSLEALRELTANEATARRRHGAWESFRRFLTVDGQPRAGFKVERLGAAQPSVVSAKILSTRELDRVGALLGSVRSGIGTLGYRDVASRHFRLTRGIGARRAETEYLRWQDVDGDQLRIRPYPGRTLKTPAAERVAPLGLLESSTVAMLAGPRGGPGDKVIDAFPGQHASGDNFFDAASKAMKAATGDPDIGPHHLRHTMASGLMLGVLGNAVNLDLTASDLPWVHELMPSPDQLRVLLGSEGQCGQGLKAISVLLGHLHETTTLHHYVHTLCVALYAHTLSLPEIPLQVAFERRLGSRATLHRWAKLARAGGRDAKQVARAMRDRLETLAARRVADKEALSDVSSAVVATKCSATEMAPAVGGTGDILPEAEALMLQFERWQKFLTDGKGGPPDSADGVASALQQIACIPTGKRGALGNGGQPLRRHALSVIGQGGIRLPTMVAAGTASTHAARLIDWLWRLAVDAPEDHQWLIDKWLYASDAREGSLRLDSEQDLARIARLSSRPGIDLDVRADHVAANRNVPSKKRKYRLRIRFVDEAPQTSRSTKQYGQRQAGAVRWAMTWMAVRWMLG